MLTKDLSITFCGVKFPNPFCLSSSPVGNCYEMCAKAYDTGWVRRIRDIDIQVRRRGVDARQPSRVAVTVLPALLRAADAD